MFIMFAIECALIEADFEISHMKEEQLRAVAVAALNAAAAELKVDRKDEH